MLASALAIDLSVTLLCSSSRDEVMEDARDQDLRGVGLKGNCHTWTVREEKTTLIISPPLQNRLFSASCNSMILYPRRKE